MIVADNDLLAVQEARILAENAAEARVHLASFSQEKLDVFVDAMARAAEEHARDLALLSSEETGCGRWEDKLFKNRFICAALRRRMAGMRCVGELEQDPESGIATIGVPLGVLAAFSPAVNPVSTTLCHILLAVKSGNAIVVSPHPRAASCTRKAVDILIAAGEPLGLPTGAISRMDVVNAAGAYELMRHEAVSLLLLNGSEDLRGAAKCSGKAAICGGAGDSMGNGPAFVERSADIRQAAADIVRSKTFDNGLVPAAETALVADAPIDAALRAALAEQGARFLADGEARLLANLYRHSAAYPGGRLNKSAMGLPAPVLAQHAGFTVPDGTTVLLVERKFVCDSDPFAGVLAPVLPYYVEDDWRHACEKCLELLLREQNAHSMVIHSGNEDVIREFALKKPVARLLVNTPGSLGGIGVTTRLFPSLTPPLLSGCGIAAQNLSPRDLTYTRAVVCGTASREVRGTSDASSPDTILPGNAALPWTAGRGNDDRGENTRKQRALHDILHSVIQALDNPAL